jgi:NADH-quinone oxidoreductase subunit A
MTLSALPVLLVLAVAVAFAGLFLGLSYWLGPRRRDALKESPYECGIPARSTVQIHFFIRFFLVALLFLIFDLEVVFLYPWVAAFQSFLDAGMGMFSLGAVGIFFLVLVVGLVYEWRKGGLEWQ